MARFARKEIRAIIGEACTEEIENQIMALHLGVVDPMKDDIAKYKAEAERLEAVQKELDGLKANNGDDWKAKYEKEHSDYEAYKDTVTKRETKASKKEAVKAYFEGKSITGGNLDIAMMAVDNLLDGLELDGQQIKDTSALDALVNDGALSRLVVTQTTRGAKVATPPANTGGTTMTREEIRKITDTTARQKAIAENLKAYGR